MAGDLSTPPSTTDRTMPLFGLPWQSICCCCCLVRLSATPWTVTHQAPLSMRFSRQEHWSGFAISFSKESSQPRDWTRVSCSAGRFFTIWATRKPPWGRPSRHIKKTPVDIPADSPSWLPIGRQEKVLDTGGNSLQMIPAPDWQVIPSLCLSPDIVLLGQAIPNVLFLHSWPTETVNITKHFAKFRAVCYISLVGRTLTKYITMQIHLHGTLLPGGSQGRNPHCSRTSTPLSSTLLPGISFQSRMKSLAFFFASPRHLVCTQASLPASFHVSVIHLTLMGV